MELAGFPRVIATLWPVWDSSAKKIVRSFYTALAENKDPSQAAQLLHDAIREHRTNRRQRPSMWASFIHTGA
ncbi:MAG: CHAT domain-containing protein [Pseudonocardiaceae bacterium]